MACASARVKTDAEPTKWGITNSGIFCTRSTTEPNGFPVFRYWLIEIWGGLWMDFGLDIRNENLPGAHFCAHNINNNNNKTKHNRNENREEYVRYYVEDETIMR